MTPGDRLTLLVDKPAAGGRMIARHDGAIVLVAGAIPGEQVDAVVEKVQRGTIWARTERVLAPSPDRVEPAGDPACGGTVFSHVRYPRQLSLKREILRDAFARIGRLALPAEVPVEASPREGYRMRARLHLRGGRLGFFREGTHDICDAAATGQLRADTSEVLAQLPVWLPDAQGDHQVEVEVVENCEATQRVVHLLWDTRRPPRLRTPPDHGVTGISCATANGQVTTLWGSPDVTDTLRVTRPTGELTFTLVRHARAFFQGNRYLLTPLVGAVLDAAGPGSALDLYAGVGLFAVALAARGDTTVVAVEGDAAAAHDLQRNAALTDGRIDPWFGPVERFRARPEAGRFDTVIVDPPRTGMSREALGGAIALSAPRVVYVSCDVATLARDARTLGEAGYRLAGIRSFDLFPDTAHLETLAVFDLA